MSMKNQSVVRALATTVLFVVAAAFMTMPARAQDSCSNGSPPPCTGGDDDSGVGVGDQIGLTQPPPTLPPVEPGADAIGSILAPFSVPLPATPPANGSSQPGEDVQPVSGNLGQPDAPPTVSDWQNALQSSPLANLDETKIQMLPDMLPESPPGDSDGESPSLEVQDVAGDLGSLSIAM
jgi:hypothetical protein